MSNLLSVKNISKKYENFELDNISFDIPEGSIVGFIGENGAGKTTTIKAILNLINVDSGNIKFFNKNFLEYENEIKENIGVILDNSYFPFEFNSKDINSVMKKLYLNWDDNLFFNYLKKFNLPLNKSIKDYSTGMLMKLKIASALAHKPKLLILDEPTNGLDPIARSEILDIFQEFVEDEHNSIFISSHITSDLETVADFIIFISNGKIILNDKKDNLIDNYAIVKCSEKEFSSVDKNDYLKYKKNKYECKLLINNKKEFKRKYKIKTIDKPSLDEIMLLFVKGEKNE